MDTSTLTNDELAEYLAETGADYAAHHFQDQDEMPLTLWQQWADPMEMLELLEALRPAHYPSRLRRYMLDALELALPYFERAGEPVELNDLLIQALAETAERAAGERPLYRLPSQKRMHALANEPCCPEPIVDGCTLVSFAAARNVVFGAHALLPRLIGVGYRAVSEPMRATWKAEHPRKKLAWQDPAARAADEAGTIGREQMAARLAELLRHHFPDPFSD